MRADHIEVLGSTRGRKKKYKRIQWKKRVEILLLLLMWNLIFNTWSKTRCFLIMLILSTCLRSFFLSSVYLFVWSVGNYAYWHLFVSDFISLFFFLHFSPFDHLQFNDDILPTVPRWYWRCDKSEIKKIWNQCLSQTVAVLLFIDLLISIDKKTEYCMRINWMCFLLLLLGFISSLRNAVYF